LKIVECVFINYKIINKDMTEQNSPTPLICRSNGYLEKEQSDEQRPLGQVHRKISGIPKWARSKVSKARREGMLVCPKQIREKATIDACVLE
jgi:hypothetical protein